MIYLSYPDGNNFTLQRGNSSYEKVNLQEQNILPQEFKIKYPFIKDAKDNTVYANINNFIIDKTLGLLKQEVFLTEKTDFEEILEEYNIMLNENGILSIVFSIYTYIKMYAHGYTAYDSLNINLKTGQIYKFTDLFNSKLNYKVFLDEIIKKKIKENNVPILTDYEGIKGDEKFYLTKTSLVIYYSVYEYTPYYYGLFKIDIPYKEITNLLGAVSPIQKLL